MTLTPEQARQFQADFEEWWETCLDDLDYASAIAGFQAAWRPRPSVDEIESIIEKSCHPIDYSECRGLFDSECELVATKIHRAQGGQE